MSDKKYRHANVRPAPDVGQTRRPTPQSRPSGMLPRTAVRRCAECAATLPITADSLANCPNCRAELHACRQCSHFDTAQKFECTQAIAERIADKRARNECSAFALRVTVERDTSGGTIRPDDARRSFGNLFKK